MPPTGGRCASQAAAAAPSANCSLLPVKLKRPNSCFSAPQAAATQGGLLLLHALLVLLLALMKTLQASPCSLRCAGGCCVRRAAGTAPSAASGCTADSCQPLPAHLPCICLLRRPLRKAGCCCCTFCTHCWLGCFTCGAWICLACGPRAFAPVCRRFCRYNVLWIGFCE